MTPLRFQNIRVAPVRIFCWTVNSPESSENCAAWPHRRCTLSQSGQVLGLIHTQRALPPIHGYGRFECAPERFRTPATAELLRARRAVRRAYQAPLPIATTRAFQSTSHRCSRSRVRFEKVSAVYLYANHPMMISRSSHVSGRNVRKLRKLRKPARSGSVCSHRRRQQLGSVLLIP
jgi:hypothetical protein